MILTLNEERVERVLCGWDDLPKAGVLLYLYVSTSTGTLIYPYKQM